MKNTNYNNKGNNNNNKGNNNKGNNNKGNNKSNNKVTKNDVIKAFWQYVNYTTTNNCHVIPQSGINSGNEGRTAELAVKLALGNYKGAKGISNAKQKDTFKMLDGSKASFEIKSGCGVLANIDSNGNYYGAMLKSNYVIYIPEYKPYIPVTTQAYVLPVGDFIEILTELRLIRLKYSGAQYEIVDGKKQRKTNAFHDRLTIQTFSNSKKKTALLYNALDRYADNMVTFFGRYGIRVNQEF